MNLILGSICQKKDKKKEFYIRLAPGVELDIRVHNKDGELIGETTLKDGDYLNMQTPQERIQFLVDNEHISESKGEEILENIPSYVKYEVSVSTKRKAKSSKAKGKSKKATDEDDDF